jgi:uncharacterized protein (DUF433 family)
MPGTLDREVLVAHIEQLCERLGVNCEPGVMMTTPHDRHPPRIIEDPDVMGGVACFAGSRLPVETLIACVNASDGWERIVDNWPWLTEQHLAAARAWVAQS